MEETLYLLASELKELLNRDERLISLNKIEKKMEENEEVELLSYQKDIICSEYSSLLNIYSSEDSHIKDVISRLSTAKSKLQDHPLVRQYLEKYKVVKELYEEINKILFSSFIVSLCPKEK